MDCPIQAHHRQAGRIWILNLAVLMALLWSASLVRESAWPPLAQGWGAVLVAGLITAGLLPGVRFWFSRHRGWWVLPALTLGAAMLPSLFIENMSDAADAFARTLLALFVLLLIVPLGEESSPGWRESALRFWIPAAAVFAVSFAISMRNLAIPDEFVEFSLGLLILAAWLVFFLSAIRHANRCGLRVAAMTVAVILICDPTIYSQYSPYDFQFLDFVDYGGILLLPLEVVGILQSPDLMYYLNPAIPTSDLMNSAFVSSGPVSSQAFSFGAPVLLTIAFFAALAGLVTRAGRWMGTRAVIGLILLAVGALMCSDFEVLTHPFLDFSPKLEFHFRDKLVIMLPGLMIICVTILFWRFDAPLSQPVWRELARAFRWSAAYGIVCLALAVATFAVTYMYSHQSVSMLAQSSSDEPPSPLELKAADTILKSRESEIEGLRRSNTTQWAKASSGAGITTLEQAAMVRAEWEDVQPFMRDVMDVAGQTEDLNYIRVLSLSEKNSRFLNARVIGRFLSGQVEARLVEDDVASAVEYTSAVLRLGHLFASPEAPIVDNMIGMAIMGIGLSSAEEVLSHVDHTTNTLIRVSRLEALDRALTFRNGISPVIHDAYAPIRRETDFISPIHRLMVINAGTSFDRALSQCYQRVCQMLWLRAQLRVRLFREQTGRFPVSTEELVNHFPRTPDDGVIKFLVAPWWRYFQLQTINESTVRLGWIQPTTHERIIFFTTPQPTIDLQWSPEKGYDWSIVIQEPPLAWQ